VNKRWSAVWSVTPTAGDNSDKCATTAYADRAASMVKVNSQSASYTCVAADAGGLIYHPSSDTTARTWTIPSNAAVPYPIGTMITFDNDYGAGAITIGINTDVLSFVGVAGGTGNRTLAPGGQATAYKATATRWRISGVGLS
jgi:hypothetical protein